MLEVLGEGIAVNENMMISSTANPISLVTAWILMYKLYRRAPHLFMKEIEGLRAMLGESEWKSGTGDDLLDEIIETAGYSYDPNQDMFYSNVDSWQKNMGYCRLYDEAAAPLGMIMDCEPIPFEYDGKRWLIEFWKGQYDLTTGCEVGIYYTEEPDLDIAGVFTGAFYDCVKDEDRLLMSFALKKNGKTLFTREDTHWWLAGFKLGEFSQPSELSMDIAISFKCDAMRDAFIEGLKRAGYSEEEFIISSNIVGIKFGKPHTPQPITRTEVTDRIIQKKNKLLCDMYKEITKQDVNISDKIKAIQKKSPELYEEVFKIGKTKEVYEMHESLIKFLN